MEFRSRVVFHVIFIRLPLLIFRDVRIKRAPVSYCPPIIVNSATYFRILTLRRC
jgi:hypothetical protein